MMASMTKDRRVFAPTPYFHQQVLENALFRACNIWLVSFGGVQAVKGWQGVAGKFSIKSRCLRKLIRASINRFIELSPSRLPGNSMPPINPAPVQV